MSTAITNTYFASEDRQMDRLVPLLCLNIEGFTVLNWDSTIVWKGNNGGGEPPDKLKHWQ